MQDSLAGFHVLNSGFSVSGTLILDSQAKISLIPECGPP